MTNKNIRFTVLDTFRGVAALAIALFHFIDGWGGYIAVDFFLVLSGFILSHSYLYSDKKNSLGSFINHRIARLYPLHVFTLITFVLTIYIFNGGFPKYPDGTLFTLFQHLTLTHNIGLNPHGITYNPPSWSISVEFWVNVLFILFISKSTKSIVLLGIAVVSLYFIYINTGHLDTHFSNYYGFLNSGILRGVASFFLGILSYRMYLYVLNNPKLQKGIGITKILTTVAVATIIFARTDKLSQLDMLAPFVFMFMVTAFSFEKGLITQFLTKFNYLGEISYSIYLNQLTVLLFIGHSLASFELPRLLLLLIFVVVLIVYSHFTYKYIETPLRRKLRNLTK